MCRLQCALFMVKCTVCNVKSVVGSVHCAMYSVQCVVYSVCTVQYVVVGVQFKVFSAHCLVSNVQFVKCIGCRLQIAKRKNLNFLSRILQSHKAFANVN